MDSAGGVTVFAASAPNGPLIVRLPFLGPFPPPQTDTLVDYGWYFPGIPPGTYYVAVLLGVIDTPNIAAADWTPAVVPGSCTTVPGMGLVSRNLAGVVSDSVRLFLSSYGGCATSYSIEVGTSPGAANVALIEQAGVLLNADGVPPGTYYVRATGRNQLGLGPSSAVLAVSVPDCSTGMLGEIDDFRVTVAGNQVTLNWTPPVTPPGRPITYYEIGLLNGVVNDQPHPRFLIPTAVSSFSANVPSGAYLINLNAGNACDTWTTDGLAFTVP